MGTSFMACLLSSYDHQKVRYYKRNVIAGCPSLEAKPEENELKTIQSVFLAIGEVIKIKPLLY